MPRKGKVPTREVLPDPKYHSKLVAKFINSIMWDGKRSVAESILYDALETIGQRSKEDPWRFAPAEARRWPFDGSYSLPVPGARRA
jgi:small subunit ribosomal protein S7